MRNVLLVSLSLLISACATAPSTAPKQYLDEQTAATITVVAEPWIFNREGAPPQLDFVHLYAIDVNRMGEHCKYLVVVKHWPAPDLPGNAAPELEIQARDGKTIRLNAIGASARELGIGQPLDSAAPKGTKTWFYPLQPPHLDHVATADEIRVGLIEDEIHAMYVVWRDGRAAFEEFVAGFR